MGLILLECGSARELHPRLGFPLLPLSRGEGSTSSAPQPLPRPSLPDASDPRPPSAEPGRNAGFSPHGNIRRRLALSPSASHTRPLFEVLGNPAARGKWPPPWRAIAGNCDRSLGAAGPGALKRPAIQIRPLPTSVFPCQHDLLCGGPGLLGLPALSGRSQPERTRPSDQRLGTSAASGLLVFRPLHTKTLSVW